MDELRDEIADQFREWDMRECYISCNENTPCKYCIEAVKRADQIMALINKPITIDIQCEICSGRGEYDSDGFGNIINCTCDNGKAPHVVEWKWDLGVINNSGDMHCSKLLIDHDLRNPDVAIAYGHLLHCMERWTDSQDIFDNFKIDNNKGTLRLRKAK